MSSALLTDRIAANEIGPFIATSKAHDFGDCWRFTEVGSTTQIIKFLPSGLAWIFYGVKSFSVTTGISGAVAGDTSLFLVNGENFPPPTEQAGLFGAGFGHKKEVLTAPGGSFSVSPEGVFFDGHYYPGLGYQSFWSGGPGEVSTSNFFGSSEIGTFTFLGQSIPLYGSGFPAPSGDVTVDVGTEW